MSAMEKGAMPKPSELAKAAFTKLVPAGSTVSLRPMFGNLAAFVNANMFLALFGDQVAVRLPEEDRGRLLREPGASVFEPMPGRAMAEYIVLPAAWSSQKAKTGRWVKRSFEWAVQLPPKKK